MLGNLSFLCGALSPQPRRQSKRRHMTHSGFHLAQGLIFCPQHQYMRLHGIHVQGHGLVLPLIVEIRAAHAFDYVI